jgi:hypothetical protein
MGTGFYFPKIKRPKRGVDQPPPSSAEVKERVELYLYSPFAFVACSRVNMTFTFYIADFFIEKFLEIKRKNYDVLSSLRSSLSSPFLPLAMCMQFHTTST